MSNLRINNRGESRYHGPTSASFSAPEPPSDDVGRSLETDQARISADGANNNGAFTTHRQQYEPVDPAMLKDRLTTMAASERQQEVMNVVSGKLDFDGVEPELALHLLNLHWNR